MKIEYIFSTRDYEKYEFLEIIKNLKYINTDYVVIESIKKSNYLSFSVVTPTPSKYLSIIIFEEDAKKYDLIHKYLLDYRENNFNKQNEYIYEANEIFYEFATELEDKLFNLINKQKSARS